jgi:hypothetical protein
LDHSKQIIHFSANADSDRIVHGVFATPIGAAVEPLFVQPKRVMLTVSWSTRGSNVVKWTEEGHPFNTTYLLRETINELLTDLKATGKFADK